MPDTIKDRYKIPIPAEDYFDDLHTMVLTIGFPRSGSSLVGYLLTAHPNIIMAHEPKVKNLYQSDDIMMILNYILYTDQRRFRHAAEVHEIETTDQILPQGTVKKRTFYPVHRYVFVPHQWQNRCKSLNVIGIKRSYSTTRILSKKNTLEQFNLKLKKEKISLKFVFTVRNPYDMVITGIMNYTNNRKITDTQDKQKMIDNFIKRATKNSQFNKKVLNQIQSIKQIRNNVYINKHEDIIATPQKELAKLCNFLNVDSNQDYLNDCASVVHEKPRKSRYELDWTEIQKEEVAKLVEQYDFFSGYNWSS